MQGNIVRQILSNYYVDVVLISCTALEVDGGVFDSNEEEAELKRLLVNRGQKTILLADHTKFGCVGFSKLADIKEIDTVITDQKPSQEWLELLADSHVEVVYPL